ncbi:MAG: phenylacetic acid degradation operon negative regulatory protein PaaX [Nevskia sp.]|nr:phenylacetic acid degradation operon negative regulatory protein PaaX [Nevskia sp.]
MNPSAAAAAGEAEARIPRTAASVAGWIRRCLREEQPRSKSLIVTILGDSIVPCGSAIWLGDLIGLLEPFGVNERLARTSTSRLAEEGWIEARRDGRRSRYALTPSGTARFEHAFQRIYAPPLEHWDGMWTQVVLLREDTGAQDRADLRRELQWEGYGLLAPGIFLHPAANLPALEEILDRLELRGRAVVLQGRAAGSPDAPNAAALADQCWALDACAQEYRRFLTRFEPLLRLLDAGEALSPADAFVAQTLLIHAFRRVSLHDPRLPAPMLPSDWPGHAAYRVCRELYRRTEAATWRHLTARVSGLAGSPGLGLAVFQHRFEA